MLLQEHKQLFEQNTQIKAIFKNGQRVWPTVAPDYSEPFYVENTGNDVQTLSIVKKSSAAPTLTIEYSTDKSQWTPFENPTSTTAITLDLQPGDKVYLRCETERFCIGGGVNNISGVSKVGGNIMSLLYGSSFTGRETTFKSTNGYVFDSLFSGMNRILTDASKLLLPATTLTTSCYNRMFYNCLALRTAPELPATTLAPGCYSNMFYCCNLRTAPKLPATTLATSCYYQMFENCYALTSAPALPATILANQCYYRMFYNCSGLTSAPALPATTLAVNCYQSMFSGCTSLVTSPVLAAPTLVQSCYYMMFERCRNLVNITCLATDRSAQNATASWLYNASTTGTFTKARWITWPTSTSGIPSGWTIVEV